MNIEIDNKANTLEFYKSSSNVITGTNTKTPSQAGQLRSFTNVLGTFTARWTTDAGGNAVFAGYLNDKNQTVETSLNELKEFASSKLGRLWLWAMNLAEQDLKDINNDPIGHNLKIGFAMVSMSIMADAEAGAFPTGRGYNPSRTTLENMSGLGGSIRPTALPNGSFYSVAFETSIPSSLYPGGSYWNHFKAANTNLNNAMIADASFANSMKALGIKIPTSSRGIQGVSPQNWVWHHDVKTGILQLVPKSQHPNNFGGIFWNTMHPSGSGGNALWNK